MKKYYLEVQAWREKNRNSDVFGLFMAIACELFDDMVPWLTARFVWELPHVYTHRQEHDRSLILSGFCHALVCPDPIILGLSLSTHGVGRQEGSPQALLGLDPRPRPWRGGPLALDLGEEQHCLPGMARTALHWRREWKRTRTPPCRGLPLQSSATELKGCWERWRSWGFSVWCQPTWGCRAYRVDVGQEMTAAACQSTALCALCICLQLFLS